MIRARLSPGEFEHDRDKGRRRMLLEIGNKKFHLTQIEAEALKADIELYLKAAIAVAIQAGDKPSPGSDSNAPAR